MRLLMLAVASLLMAVAPSLAGSQAKGGTVCIAPVTEDMRKEDRGDPRGLHPRRELDFSVEIDKSARVRVPDEKPVVIRNLDLKAKHIVKIRDGEKIIESFYFSFRARHSSSLCLAYGPWYETWDLSLPGRRRWCKCE